MVESGGYSIMILNIVLLVLFIIFASLIAALLYYMLIPAAKNDKLTDKDSFVSNKEIEYIQPDVEEVEISDKKAVVLCSCHKNFKVDRTIFNEQHTCFMINSDNGTGTDCKFSCIGLGDCVKACPQEAISIVNQTAVVSKLCIGCGKCIDVCPLHIIRLVPKTKETILLCGNADCEPTSCSDLLKDEDISWHSKKGFKIWKYWYKLIKGIIKN